MDEKGCHSCTWCPVLIDRGQIEGGGKAFFHAEMVRGN
jgi:hypothetical protein